ncbi:helix-turn-helix domain-containing protein [Polymorphobacter sp.]|uniref:helix-turn-helix domain-containing protein n=1 Tax=Polymorphobacter sp. TaxID=1909290 RepID=UPI003F6E58E2
MMADNGAPASMGDRIIAALDGRTLKWLSSRTGVPMQTLSNATRHGSMLGAEKAALIARALKVPAEWLILGDGPSPVDVPTDLSRSPTEDITTLMLARLMPPAGPGRRMRWPSWYHDKPVLAAVVRTHRQAEIDRVLSDLQERFGTRAPTRSSLARFWLRLDEMYHQTRVSK